MGYEERSLPKVSVNWQDYAPRVHFWDANFLDLVRYKLEKGYYIKGRQPCTGSCTWKWGRRPPYATWEAFFDARRWILVVYLDQDLWDIMHVHCFRFHNSVQTCLHMHEFCSILFPSTLRRSSCMYLTLLAPKCLHDTVSKMSIPQGEIGEKLPEGLSLVASWVSQIPMQCMSFSINRYECLPHL